MLLLMRRDIRLLLDDSWLYRSRERLHVAPRPCHRTRRPDLEEISSAAFASRVTRRRPAPAAERMRAARRPPVSVVAPLSVRARLRDPCLPEEGQDALRRLVGLREHARAGLLQDLVLGELDHLGSHIHVADAALGGHEVLLVGRQVAERVLEAVLDRAELAAQRRDVADRLVDRRDRRARHVEGGDHVGERGRGHVDLAVGVVGADLERDRGGRVQQLDAVELGRATNALHLVDELGGLGGDGRLVAVAQGAGLVLHGQLADTLEHGVNLAERTLRSLHEADRVLRVALSLRQTADLATQLLADRQAGSVVGRTVDARAGAQALHRLLDVVARGRQLTVSVERLDVVVDAKGHSVFSLMTVGCIGPVSDSMSLLDLRHRTRRADLEEIPSRVFGGVLRRPRGRRSERRRAARRPPVSAIGPVFRQGPIEILAYRRRARTPCGAWLPCASMLVPACCRIWFLENWTISAAISTSRMRLSEAMRFSW